MKYVEFFGKCVQTGALIATKSTTSNRPSQHPKARQALQSLYVCGGSGDGGSGDVGSGSGGSDSGSGGGGVCVCLCVCVFMCVCARAGMVKTDLSDV